MIIRNTATGQTRAIPADASQATLGPNEVVENVRGSDGGALHLNRRLYARRQYGV